MKKRYDDEATRILEYGNDPANWGQFHPRVKKLRLYQFAAAIVMIIGFALLIGEYNEKETKEIEYSKGHKTKVKKRDR